jgi:hypothetical protein
MVDGLHIPILNRTEKLLAIPLNEMGRRLRGMRLWEQYK